MFGKAITHFIRISAILHCFEIAFEILTNLKVDNKFVLSLKLKDQIDEAIEMNRLMMKWHWSLDRTALCCILIYLQLKKMKKICNLI